VFLFIGTIGISTSKKLGKKYVYRGIKLAFVIIMILIVIMSLGVFGSMTGLGENADATVSEIFSSLSSQPFGGDKTIPLYIEGVDSASLDLQWGLGLGGQLLLVAGLIIVIAGVLLFVANTTFFEQKHFEKSKKGKKEKLVNAETEKVEQETEDVKENEDVGRSDAEPSEEEKNESLESTEGKT
jgi:flagellar basal body-associated protein FliL